MTIAQLDTENADRDITSVITVLTHTPSASNHMICMGYVALGDGSKNLDGTGGAFELTITVGGQTVQPAAQSITFGTEVRSSVWTTPFPVPANAEVILRVKSPNAADTDVDVTAYLYDASAAGVAVGSVTATVSADVVSISGDSTAANNAELFFDGTGYAAANSTIGTCTTNTDMRGTDSAATAAALATVDTVVDAILADTGTDGVVLSAAYLNKIADHVLRRSWESAADSSDGDTKAFRSLLGAVAKLVNKISVAGATLSIFEEDDSTVIGQQALSTDAAASPITAADTA